MRALSSSELSSTSNLFVAKATAPEIGHVSLVEALELMALTARKDLRHPRVAAEASG